MEKSLRGEQRSLSAVEHDAETAKNHGEREERDSALGCEVCGGASWRGRADGVRR